MLAFLEILSSENVTDALSKLKYALELTSIKNAKQNSKHSALEHQIALSVLF